MTTRTVHTGSAELTVDDVGHGEPTLIFLHYWGGAARTWQAVLDCLPQGPRKIALDQRGWGSSRALDGRYDLEALADDVLAVVEELAVGSYIVVGHSMGGKVAQVLAGRRPPGLVGLVLVAPAPPHPMQVPPDARAGMLASYQSREGVLQALEVLSGQKLDAGQSERIIADTLRGNPDAKRYWPQEGMLADIRPSLAGLSLPVDILVGEHDRVEQEAALRQAFESSLPDAAFTAVPGVGHLMPLEAPEAIAARCQRMMAAIGSAT